MYGYNLRYGLWVYMVLVLQIVLVLYSTLYSVMQLDGSSFGGDVVLDSGYMASSYKDSMLYLIYERHIFSKLYNKDFRF